MVRRGDSDGVPLEREQAAFRSLSGALRDLQENSPSHTQAHEIRYLLTELEQRRAELELQNRQLRESQAALEESHARYADLYDFAPVAYLRMDRSAKILEANLTAATLFRSERGKLLGRPLTALVTSTSRPLLLAHVRACFGEAIRVTSEISVGGRGGSVVVQITSTPVLDADGRAIACKSTLTDVSEQKHAQEVLRFLGQASTTLSASFDYASTISETIEQAVPLLGDIAVADIFDRDDELRRIQVAAGDSRHYRLARIARSVHPPCGPGTPLGWVLHSCQPLVLADCQARTLRGEADGLVHEAFVQACMPQSLMYVPILARGTALGALTFMTSTSGRRFGDQEIRSVVDLGNRMALAIENARLYEQATRAIKTREQVMSVVSHDLKNPLMGILLSTELLLSRAPAEERRRAWKQLDRIRRGVQQMRHMVEDLLDASGIEAGRLLIELGRHRADDLLRDALELLEPIAQAKAVEVKADFGAPAVELVCDRHRIVQVLNNLIGNAIKFTPRSGEVTISLARAGADLVFTIQDSGPGIAGDLLPHLFQRYVQSDATARQGRGLGLFIARGIVQAHGGRIWADPNAKRGARFQFTIPLAAPAQVTSSSEETPASEAPRDLPSATAGSE
jgi:PAS domain S-box-containing protein